MNWLERSWYNKAYWSYLLAPLSVLFWLVSTTRRLLYRLGISKQNKFATPVIVVGNITVGGTGKTPFVVYLIALLKQQGFKPAIVSRGYGAEENADFPFPRLVTSETDVRYSGDEPKLLAMKTQVPVVISPNRSEAVSYINQHTDCDVVISDDGLQHYAMARSMEVVLLDQQRGVGNGWLLPVGPLRESKKRLQSVDLVLQNAGFSENSSLDYRLASSSPYHISEQTLLADTSKKVHLISGIGNPQRFMDTSKGMGLEVDSCNWLPDHHNFTLDDFAQYSDTDIVVMTEKDAVKCIDLLKPEHRASSKWYVLPIEARISSSVEQQILAKIKQLK